VKQFRIRRFAALSTLSAVLFAGAAFAQDDHHDDAHHQAYVRHDEWKKGYHMKDEDWKRGEAVDYRTYHLKAPPRGYEWREVDGNYVLAAVATGIVASAIVAASIH
jgi:Ni/Co efflux regulator RcnB